MTLIKTIATFTLASSTIAASNGGFCVTAFTTPTSGLLGYATPSSTSCRAHHHGNIDDDNNNLPLVSRRDAFSKSLLVGAASAMVFSDGLFSSPEEAVAFPNKVSNKFDDRPKQRGAKPKGLGVAKRYDMGSEEYMGLKNCGAAPNCFCSTDNVDDDPEHSIPSWKYPTNLFSSKEEAFRQLYDVVKAYPPGQENIDGGGFDIVTFDPKAGYMYVQFESLKNGFIDDVEFAVIDDKSNVVDVRSSSRLGYLDFGVNAKRLNYLAKSLREKGWEAPGVELETHRGYAEENGAKF